MAEIGVFIWKNLSWTRFIWWWNWLGSRRTQEDKNLDENPDEFIKLVIKLENIGDKINNENHYGHAGRIATYTKSSLIVTY